MRLPLLVASAALVLAGCGDDGHIDRSDDQPSSGISGQVLLGPQCPVESVGEPCDDLPAANVLVKVAKQIPGEAYGAGEPVATTHTDADGAFELALPPGDYVVTADAGMSCEFMDARVVAGAHTTVDVPCDTGIR
ncbi:hypothetical protein NSZ01_17540 [Nocardioides szechwanensis]|uniref:Carboxypeptidase regulatory-like domain-containing protein n=1 Tax=Nocardioides szechwanensis TaxID=1005944 RepID=A0A1G9ZPD6_9ACTN|nr:carboxypeptidase-like regulatory domain-containing protein [Nocardioides szechwanensis]GEP33986.1 hypothetical protein NSZ01_17540 [Nocardioides szechwanensis]SDN22493.1 Carboxypeptidase regulatory-like domain-containing protein [Nocardioides szechwanensis]